MSRPNQPSLWRRGDRLWLVVAVVVLAVGLALGLYRDTAGVAITFLFVIVVIANKRRRSQFD